MTDADAKQIGATDLFTNARFSVDDTLAYTGLVHSMLSQCELVVDVGCGRGRYADDTTTEPNLFDFRGSGRQIVGLDIDPAAEANPYIDEFRQLPSAQAPWPIEDGAADLIVSDWTLEHVDDPTFFVEQVTHSLHVGGAFVARSVNRRSLLSIAARLVPNDRHVDVLRRAQPFRHEVDVFPTRYLMNTPRRLAELFGDRYEYSVAWRPGLENYARSAHPRAADVVASVERRLPEWLHMTFILSARLRAK